MSASARLIPSGRSATRAACSCVTVCRFLGTVFTAVPWFSGRVDLAVAQHLPQGRHQAGTAISSSTKTGTTSAVLPATDTDELDGSSTVLQRRDKNSQANHWLPLAFTVADVKTAVEPSQLRACRPGWGVRISVDVEALFSRAIAEGVRAGDPEALAHVYGVLFTPLTTYLRSQVRDPHVADDLAQETFVELVRGCRTLTGDPAQIRGWIFQAARRNAIDHSRYNRRRPVQLFAEMPDAWSEEQGPSETTVYRDDAEQMRQALARLGPGQAQVLTLRFLGGLSAAEVSAIMGKSEGAVRALQRRGVAALAKVLRDDLQADARGPVPVATGSPSGGRK